ncbi:PEGA domain-containing protein [Pendulispora brunnea]|uniref:PEGA domain-containing protein n=1 Tax=Pendulispora brunnea TaxID=2905690 RepID=A0ABZ2KMR1_9BACT
MRTHVHFALAPLVAFSLVASSAWAQQSDDPSAIAAARSLGVEGVKLADAGNCSEAIPKLERAEVLHHAPTTLGRLGECQIALGKLVLGSEILQKVVREQLPQSAPSAFVHAKHRAKRALEEVLPRIAKLHLRVEAPPNVTPAAVRVALDGDALGAEWMDIDRPIDPGVHTLTATSEGHADASSTVTLADGERAEVTLTLTANPEPVPEPPPPVTAEPPPAPRPAEASPKPTPHPALAPASEPSNVRHTAGLVLLGASGAAFVFGGVFGLMALDTKRQLDDACGPTKACPANQQNDISALKTQSTLATIGFATAGVTLAAGGVLLLTEPSSSTASSSNRASGLCIGPTSVSWQGRF